MNTVAISGRLGRDPEIKTTSTQKKVARFTVAVNGYNKNDVAWIDCEAWNASADYIAQYIHKGDMVLVEGALRQEKWQGQDGTQKSRILINARNVQGITRNNNTQAAEHATAQSLDIESDDLPF